MRITVEIDVSNLKKIQSETKEKKISPAVNAALREFLENRRRNRIIQKFVDGRADYSSTNEDLEKRDIYETR